MEIQLDLKYDTAVIASYRFSSLEDANKAIVGFKRLLDASEAELVAVSVFFETLTPAGSQEVTALANDPETAALLQQRSLPLEPHP